MPKFANDEQKAAYREYVRKAREAPHDRFQCSQCGYRLWSENALYTHIGVKHPGTRVAHYHSWAARIAAGYKRPKRSVSRKMLKHA